MNMIPTFIAPLIFINSSKETPKCPECGMDEEKVTFCKHCNHEYSTKESSDLKEFLIAMIVIIIILWFMFTLISWLSNDDSLQTVLRDQWHWISTKRFLD